MMGFRLCDTTADDGVAPDWFVGFSELRDSDAEDLDLRTELSGRSLLSLSEFDCCCDNDAGNLALRMV